MISDVFRMLLEGLRIYAQCLNVFWMIMEWVLHVFEWWMISEWFMCLNTCWRLTFACFWVISERVLNVAWLLNVLFDCVWMISERFLDAGLICDVIISELLTCFNNVDFERVWRFCDWSAWFMNVLWMCFDVIGWCIEWCIEWCLNVVWIVFWYFE